MKSRFGNFNFLVVGIAACIAGQLIAPDGSGAGLQAAFAKKGKGANTGEPSEQNFNEGVSRYKDRDFDGAIDSFLQSIYYARIGYQPEAYFWLGKCYMAKHEDPKAIEAFKKHVEQTMHHTPQAHVYLAEIYLRNDKDHEAETEAGRAMVDAMGPCPEAHNVMGKILVRRKQITDAESQFLDALGDHPWKYTDAWMNYAESQMKGKNWIKAYDLFEKMVEAKGRLDKLDLPKVYLDMGLCKLARGDHQGAIDNFHQCLEIDPGYSAAHLELAILFEAETHLSSAIKEYSDYVQSTPPDEPKVKLAKERILLLQQKMNVQAPAVVAPSPYMRQQQELQMKKVQQQQAPKDPGF